ncbi:MAG TPA: phosphotransferase [Gemmatimonadaceae bacterium]|nr:phosphotransferase [Gemmatimonadaceae bacterium]
MAADGFAMTPEGAIRYLLDQQLLDVRDLVEGEVRAEELWGRNENLRVVSRGARSYFVKQARPGDEDGSAAIATEAELYARVHAVARAWPLRTHLPRLVRHDPARALLTLELVVGARGADEIARSDASPGVPPIGAALGSALAACHATLRPDGEIAAGAGFLESSPPTALEIARPSPDDLRDISPAQIELLQLVQQRPHVFTAFDDMRDGWSASSLIHGDVKWSNVLVSVETTSTGPVNVWLVDWESASWGDPAWDVGSAFHSFLLDCVHAASDEAQETPAAAATVFASVLPAAERQVRMLWENYLRRTAMETALSHAFLNRAVRYGAARLVQSAYEWSAGEAHMPRSAVGAAQLSVNILEQPAIACSVLLGIAGEATAA